MNRSGPRSLGVSVFAAILVLSVGRAGAQSPTLADAGGPYAVDEGGAVVLDGSGSTTSSPPLSYAWDFDGDGFFDDAAGVAPTLDASALSGPQQLTIALEVTDAAQFTDTDTGSVSVANLAPSDGYVTGDSTGVIGESLTFSSAATDPGGDPLTWTWSWGDGSPADSGLGLTTISHSWSAPGNFLVSVLISDGLGGEFQVILPVVISNPGPSVLLLSAPSGLGEGTPGQWSVSASDALGNPVFLVWDWGDGSPTDSGLGLNTVSHSYPDDGSWNLVVTAFDVLGAQAALAIPTSVSNLDPAFVGGPLLTATQGQSYLVSLQVTDAAGDLDSLVLSVPVLPAAASFDAATATISWLPDFADSQGAPVPFTAAVTDGEGGGASQSWLVTVAYADADGDGMADSWEALNGLDPGVDDGAADPDGDGLSNLAEWLAGSDPQSFGGPSQPLSQSPVDGAVVGSTTPFLTWVNALDPDGDPLTYTVAVYEDPAGTQLFVELAGVPESSGSTTSVLVSPALSENSSYTWRVRAHDGIVFGAWSSLESFFVDQANDPPSVPQPIEPVLSTVDTPVPELVTGPVVDPDGDAFDVVVEIQDSAGSSQFLLASALEVSGWSAVPAEALVEDQQYRWRAEATDERGAASGPSDWAGFRVDITNALPPVPEVLVPAPGADVGSGFPELRVRVDPDPDGDPLSVRFTADTRADFASEFVQDLGLVPLDQASEAGVVVLEELPENVQVYARARAEDDRGGASSWLQWSFRVNAVAEAPGPVQVVAPGDGEAIDGEEAIQLRWAAAFDPEGDELTYSFRIVRDGDGVVAESAAAEWEATEIVLALAEVEGQLDTGLSLESGAWLVLGRAEDAGGELGPWGPPNRFVVLPELGEPISLDPGGTGCVCGASGAASGVSGGFLALFLFALLRVRSGLRRRRRIGH